MTIGGEGRGEVVLGFGLTTDLEVGTSRMPVRPRTDVRLNLRQRLMGRGLDRSV